MPKNVAKVGLNPIWTILFSIVADVKGLLSMSRFCHNCMSKKKTFTNCSPTLFEILSIIGIKGDLNFCGCLWRLLFQACQVENVVPSQRCRNLCVALLTSGEAKCGKTIPTNVKNLC